MKKKMEPKPSDEEYEAQQEWLKLPWDTRPSWVDYKRIVEASTPSNVCPGCRGLKTIWVDGILLPCSTCKGTGIKPDVCPPHWWNDETGRCNNCEEVRYFTLPDDRLLSLEERDSVDIPCESCESSRNMGHMNIGSAECLDCAIKYHIKAHDTKTASVLETKCEVCADEFISTHEKATNEIRDIKDAEIEELKADVKMMMRQAIEQYADFREEAKQEEQARVERILETITEDFVEMIANLYMVDENREQTFELWKSVKKGVLKKQEVKE